MKSYPMSRRDFLKAATLTGAGLVLAACTQATEAPTELPQEEPTKAPEEPTQPPPEPTEEPVEAPPAEEAVTVTVWGWWEDRMKFFQESGDKYTEQNPNVTVEVISVDQDLWQKVFASVPAGTGPTLCKMITTHYFQLRDEGLLIPLDEVVFPPSFLQEKFPNFAWEQYGRYVMPEGNQAAIFAYNKTMFEEAGLDPEVPPGTWDEFSPEASAARSLSAACWARR